MSADVFAPLRTYATYPEPKLDADATELLRRLLREHGERGEAIALTLAYAPHIDHEQGCLTEEGEDCDCQRSALLRSLSSSPHPTDNQ